MSTKKTVTVETQDYPVSYLDQNQAEVSVGVVAARNFKGENVTKYTLTRDPSRPEDGSDVGLSRQIGGSFLNHAEAQRPMFDLGFSLADVTIGRGGQDIYTLWEYPAGRLPDVQDPITWDLETWGPDRQRYAGMPLKPGIIMNGTIRGGRGMTWQSAMLRLICTNGLTRWQGSGIIHRANGSNFEPENLAEALFRIPTASQGILGRSIGHKGGVEQATRIITKFFVDEHEPEERLEMIHSTPAVLADMLSAVDRAPLWFITAILAQLRLFNQNSRSDLVTELDIQTAVTNGVNFTRFGPQAIESEEHNVARAVRMSSPLTTAISNLVGIYSLAN